MPASWKGKCINVISQASRHGVNLDWGEHVHPHLPRLMQNAMRWYSEGGRSCSGLDSAWPCFSSISFSFSCSYVQQTVGQLSGQLLGKQKNGDWLIGWLIDWLTRQCAEYSERRKLAASVFRLRNDLYCVEWGVKLYSLIVFKSRTFSNFGGLSPWSLPLDPTPAPPIMSSCSLCVFTPPGDTPGEWVEFNAPLDTI